MLPDTLYICTTSSLFIHLLVDISVLLWTLGWLYLFKSELWSPCLSLPLSLRLILWSTEAHWAHFLASASKTLSRRRPVPSPLREGALCLCEQCKPRTRGFIGFLCKPRNISLFLSPLLSYCRLQTTRFWSIKRPQQRACVIVSVFIQSGAVLLELKSKLST